MKSLSLKTIIQVINGRVAQGTDRLTIRNVVTGTQRIERGTLFFDVRREKYVHHENGDKNLSYAIVTERTENFTGLGPSVALIKVARVSEAYLKFIDYYRDLFDIPVVGVTGTCGKTTTKEMIKHILSGAYKVSATYKSYNASFRNLGYLLEIDEDTQAAVYEMGVAFPGDLKKSCRYFKPKVGVITNIGVDHLQGFENLDAYIEAKAELLEGMGFAGTLILNADDPNIRTINLKAFQGKVITFGSGKRSDYRFTGVTHQENCMKFDLDHHGRLDHLTLPGHAEFNLYNAAAAVAAAHSVGFPIEAAAARLVTFKNVEHHFEFHHGVNGSTVIDDTWSTNPTSTEAALKLLKSLAGGRKTTAVLGKMSLLGKQSELYHYLIGGKVAELGIDQLIVVGSGAEAIGHGALQRGMGKERVFFCRDSEETYDILKQSLDNHSIALVKTSMLASYRDLMEKIIVKT